MLRKALMPLLLILFSCGTVNACKIVRHKPVELGCCAPVTTQCCEVKMRPRLRLKRVWVPRLRLERVRVRVTTCCE